MVDENKLTEDATTKPENAGAVADAPPVDPVSIEPQPIASNQVQPNDVQPNDVQPNDVQPNDVQPNESIPQASAPSEPQVDESLAAEVTPGQVSDEQLAEQQPVESQGSDVAEASSEPDEGVDGDTDEARSEAEDFDESEILADDYVDEDLDEDEDAAPLEDLVEQAEEVSDIDMDWYILKVQVNRETSICDALMRRVKVAGLESYFGEILVPTEDVKEFSKSGKQRIVKRKLYPGYIVVNMSINDDTWFLVRETPGIGDFTGAAGKPAPLTPEEIERIVASSKPDPKQVTEDTVKTAIKFKVGDRVRVKEGYFQNYEGEVSNIDERNGRVTVMINIFGRPNPVELDHWQIEDL